MAISIGKIKKQTDNPYLNMYVADVQVNQTEKRFSYYYTSRRDGDGLTAKTGKIEPDAVIIYCVINKDGEDCLVLVRQMRLPLNMKVYENPAGLIDQGETAEVAAVRELKEETGLDFQVYTGGAELFRKPFAQAQGISDECACIVYGYASGEVSTDGLEEREDLEVVLANRAEVRRILSEEPVSVHGLFLFSMFLNAEEGNPFSFLNV